MLTLLYHAVTQSSVLVHSYVCRRHHGASFNLHLSTSSKLHAITHSRLQPAAVTAFTLSFTIETAIRSKPPYRGEVTPCFNFHALAPSAPATLPSTATQRLRCCRKSPRRLHTVSQLLFAVSDFDINLQSPVQWMRRPLHP